MHETSESSKRRVHSKDPRWLQLLVKKKKKKKRDANTFGKSCIGKGTALFFLLEGWVGVGEGGGVGWG